MLLVHVVFCSSAAQGNHFQSAQIMCHEEMNWKQSPTSLKGHCVIITARKHGQSLGKDASCYEL